MNSLRTLIESAAPDCLDRQAWDMLAQSLGGVERLRVYAQEYCDALEQEIGRFGALAGEPDKLVRLAHQYAGSGGTMGFMRLRVLLREIEADASRRSGEALRSQCDALKKELDRVRAAVEV